MSTTSPAPSLNLARSAFHLLSGVGWAVLYRFGLDRASMLGVLGFTLAVFVTDDVMRRYCPARRSAAAKAVFRTLSRSSESTGVASSTWYTLAMFIGVAVLPRPAFVLGLLILAVADPVAGLVGRRWGSRVLYRNKTVAGTSAFFGVAGVITLVALTLTRPDGEVSERVGIALAVAGAGALAELLGDHVPDNLSILLCTGALAAALW